ncbi:Histidine kinase-like ATPase domain-containing protein [Variovorax sp. YR752]|uniref:ATP-binding protein n=1 Tax=Variovorax sp. YR752 TaxID=1884383 RepID=UPI000BDB59AF|nr:ATP-binding protein [Variovorax sp. YR752]SOD27633.1 Histidine kinase-like ATPase domain-containing protein [Variovorax sp. YR752]
MNTMYGFISKALTDTGKARGAHVDIDFSKLQFIEPVGVVVLSNLIEYMRKCGTKGTLIGSSNYSEAVKYLDDSGFFAHYNGKPLRADAATRRGTFALTHVTNAKAVGFLHATLVPWIARQLDVPEEALASIRACIEEILHNIADHSGVNVGGVHAQFYPDKGELHLAISDFGRGIPNLVRTVEPDLTDSDALVLACKEGFTTKSNVHNRGAGLAVLMRCVTGKDRGSVWLVSGRANVSATHVGGSSRLTARAKPFLYPGTLVRIVLKMSKLPEWLDDVEPENFTWE